MFVINRKLLIASVFTLLSLNATAESIGEMLLNCEKPDGNPFRVFCHSYISGVIDVQATYGLKDSEKTIYTCFPQGINSRQSAAIFVKWAKKNPELHHNYAHTGVISSLAEAFPCTSK